jgi:hypothetical protein
MNVSEIRFELAEPVTFLLGPLAFRHIDRGSDIFKDFPARIEHRVAYRLDVSQCSVGQRNPEIVDIVSFATDRLPKTFMRRRTIFRVNALFELF